MKHTRLLATLPILLASAHAGEPKAAAIGSAPQPSRWRIGASYAPIFGLQAKFGGLGNFGTAFPVQPIAPGTNYQYDDGFVFVDSSGNLLGQTWNWGYQNSSQVSGNQIALSLASSNADASARESDEIAQGIDLHAYYSIGTIMLGGKESTWGIRAGLHYGRADISNGGSLNTATTILTDTYTVVSGSVPGAPYSGSFGGPGSRVDDTPVRSIADGTGLVTGNRDLDVHLTTLSLGPYLEIPVAPKFSLALEGGFSAALAHGSYDFDSATTLPGLGTINSSGSDSDTRILPGLYAGLTALYQIDEAWSLQFAARYQYLDNFTLQDNGSTATLSFDSAFILSLGISHAF